MKHTDRLQQYLKDTKPVLIAIDFLKILVAIWAFFFSYDYMCQLARSERFLMPFHRRLLFNPDFVISRRFYYWIVTIGGVSTALWLFILLKNFVKFTVLRVIKTTRGKEDLANEAREQLPDYPYERNSFAVVLAELQDRDGQRLPNGKSPGMLPRWLLLPEKALFTGVLVTGGIGSGKTASVAEPMLHQMIGHERDVPYRIGEELLTGKYRWSGLVTDEKGDFCTMTERICREWGREADFIRIAPDGYWKWNAIYEPGQPTWAVGYRLSKIIKRFNKGASGSDPFWETAPQELLMDYLTLIDDAEGYYSISTYLQVLISARYQDLYHQKAMERWKHDPKKLEEIDRRWKRIEGRRADMGHNLMGSLQACAKAGLPLFEYPEIRETFSPTADEYFTGPCCPWPKRIPKDETEARLFDQQHETGILLPKANIFTGFDSALDYGKIVGLDMPKTRFYNAANFVQIALKAAWQESVLRRNTKDAEGELIIRPRFGSKVGYCPTFIFADECQETVDPGDQNFMAQCRSKKGCCVWLTQSHTSIVSAMGQGKEKDADTFFSNAMNHIYFRQSDLESMKMIEKEVGTKDVAKTSVAITEGGQSSELSYSQGGFIHENLSVSETKTVQVEEKPFFETEQMKQLPDFVAIIIPSTGNAVLPATIGFTRPNWVFAEYPGLALETSWYDWPDELKNRQTLETVPQRVAWDGWGIDGPVDLTGEQREFAFMGPMAPVKPTEEAEEDEGQATEVDRGRGLDKTVEGVAESDPGDFWMEHGAEGGKEIEAACDGWKCEMERRIEGLRVM